MGGWPAGGLDLSGTWLVHPAEGDLHRHFAERDFDDAGWFKAPVPGHWRSVPELSESDGPVLYRYRFEAEPPAPDRRRFLVFEGVFYDADHWFDETYLGATDGYFAPHAFEVTGLCRASEEHLVAVEVACPPQRDRRAKRLITGVFSHWDCLDTTWNPGGIWRPVRLVETGPVRIRSLRVVCTEATEERGRLRLNLDLEADGDGTGPRPARLRARLRGDGVDLEVTRDEVLAAGSNQLVWVLEVERPPRWWPRRLGDQPLCDLAVEVEVGGEPSDARALRTGFREVRLEGWVFHINGERLFVMGSNQGPTRMALAEASGEELRRDVELALEANLDMLRIHAHVTRPELYEAADELGLLLWQDFPLQWSYARGIRKAAVRQAREMVDLLGHHPSVVLWCAHNEPFSIDVEPGERPSPAAVARMAVTMFGPTWNKHVLDRSLRRTLLRADGTRPVNPHSGILPGPTSGGTDTHFYFGWYHGHLTDLPAALRRWPRLARFVSEFGAQAVPDHAEFMEPSRWPDLDWHRLAERHACQKPFFDRHVPPAEYAGFEAWQQATQDYQAGLIQLQVEDLRRIRFRPTGGFLQFCFADSLPAVTWSVLDHRRAPKRGFAALRDACRPVLPVLDPRTGDVHVVNEWPRPYPGAVLTVEAGPVRRRFSGDVEADAVTWVGRVELVGTLDVTLRLEHPELGTVENRYPAWLVLRALPRVCTSVGAMRQQTCTHGR